MSERDLQEEKDRIVFFCLAKQTSSPCGDGPVRASLKGWGEALGKLPPRLHVVSGFIPWCSWRRYVASRVAPLVNPGHFRRPRSGGVIGMHSRCHRRSSRYEDRQCDRLYYDLCGGAGGWRHQASGRWIASRTAVTSRETSVLVSSCAGPPSRLFAAREADWLSA